MATTWSYDATDLATTPKDQVRLLVGDTDSQNWLLADQEILFNLTQENNTWGAAARSAEQIGFIFARKVDVKLGRALAVAYANTAKAYWEKAKWLRAKAMGLNTPYVGGVLTADYNTIATNEGLIAPLFTKTMMENPWTGGYTSDSLAPTPNDEAPLNDEDEF